MNGQSVFRPTILHHFSSNLNFIDWTCNLFSFPQKMHVVGFLFIFTLFSIITPFTMSNPRSHNSKNSRYISRALDLTTFVYFLFFATNKNQLPNQFLNFCLCLRTMLLAFVKVVR